MTYTIPVPSPKAASLFSLNASTTYLIWIILCVFIASQKWETKFNFIRNQIESNEKKRQYFSRREMWIQSVLCSFGHSLRNLRIHKNLFRRDKDIFRIRSHSHFFQKLNYCILQSVFIFHATVHNINWLNVDPNENTRLMKRVFVLTCSGTFPAAKLRIRIWLTSPCSRKVIGFTNFSGWVLSTAQPPPFG